MMQMFSSSTTTIRWGHYTIKTHQPQNCCPYKYQYYRYCYSSTQRFLVVLVLLLVSMMFGNKPSSAGFVLFDPTTTTTHIHRQHSSILGNTISSVLLHESKKGNSEEKSRQRKKMKLDKTNNHFRKITITEEMADYFSRTVAPLDLPEKVGKDKTYPGLILDGASGVGKTQQVFALLKSEKTVVYRLLSPSTDEQQEIYSDMRNIVDPEEDFLTLVDEAIKEVKSKNSKSAMNIRQDVFSIESLTKEIFASSNTVLKQLLQHLYHTVLKYDSTSLNLTFHSLNSREELNDVILFLDEVLPKRADNDALTRLRFVRNLGRALGMRVVIAGTAATAANMIKLPNINIDDTIADSRGRSGSPGWMEIQFIYNHIHLALPKSLDPPPLYKERPLIASILEELQAENHFMDGGRNLDGRETIKLIADKIVIQKTFSDESVLMWLCGSWLESEDGIPTSPFLLKSADLVRGHFFEPGFATWRKGDVGPDLPYFGRGICKTKIAMGNYRIALRSFKKLEDKAVWWSCVVDKGYDEGKSKGFSGVHYCMSHCVQICLAKEPILAICLSGTRPNDFQEAFARLWQETLRPPSVDGALNEFAMFAALQLASRSEKFLETVTVKDTVVNLRKLLHVSPVDDTEQTTLTVEYGKNVLIESKRNHAKTRYEEEKMPWLIPACSKDKLECAFKECGGMFTGSGWNIAGLVPGERRSRVDAKAFLWDNDMTLAWVFEFKARSRLYSLDDGETDLEEKCRNLPEKNSHAMLIAVSGNEDSMVRVWLTDKDKLRVVVVVGCGYKQK